MINRNKCIIGAHIPIMNNVFFNNEIFYNNFYGNYKKKCGLRKKEFNSFEIYYNICLKNSNICFIFIEKYV